MSLALKWALTPLNQELAPALRFKIDQKTKPLGALGRLEGLALQIGLIQQTLEPQLRFATMVVFAADHGLAQAGVSAYPQEVTRQMVLNFLAGGAAINVFCRQNGLALQVVDLGVCGELPPHPQLVAAKIAPGTANMLYQPAMTSEQCEQALQVGAEAIRHLHESGSNLVGLGEMGIGNTSSAALLMHQLGGWPLGECVGHGTGLDQAGWQHKLEVLRQVTLRHSGVSSPWEILQTLGGFEIAGLVGAILEAASRRMIILIDGFIVTAALLVASRMEPLVLEYCVFSHLSQEMGHRRLIEALGGEPLLQLDMRLGEGTGAALAYPMVEAAMNFLNEMASFSSAGVSGRHA